jgi:hypothetical protein
MSAAWDAGEKGRIYAPPPSVTGKKPGNNRPSVKTFVPGSVSVFESRCNVPLISVALGHSATLHSHAVALAHFVRPVNATHMLIRAAKTS